MRLEMYLNDELLETVDLPTKGSCTSTYVCQLMKELKTKHHKKIEACGEKACFYLCGIPSRVNTFTPLK